MNLRRYAKLLLSKRTDGPVYLVLFVTRRCPAACKHCFVERDETGGLSEITLDQARRLAQSLVGLEFLILTGGEPFQRSDLVDLAVTFHREAGVKLIGIPTNGYFTEAVLDGVRSLLDRSRSLLLGMDVSIDGVGPDHDEIRGVSGLFVRARATLTGLQRLRSEYPGRLSVAAAVTVSALNEAKLGSLYKHLKGELGIENVTCLLARGRTRDPAATRVRESGYRAFTESLACESENGSLVGYDHFAEGVVVEAVKNLRARRIAALMRGEAPYRPCFAAELSCVVMPEGAVLPCELRNETLGSLADSGWDMKRIWQSPRRQDIVRTIRDSACQCTYECFLTNGILFSTWGLPALVRETHKLARARKRRKRLAGAKGGP